MKNQLVSFGLALSMVLSVSLPAFATDRSSMQDAPMNVEYTVDMPYDYPVKPGSVEWASFTTHQEMIDACQIPTDILAQMTTKALVETVMAYPLFGDIFVWDSLDHGYQVICNTFNGSAELLEREDAYEAICEYEHNSIMTSDVASTDNSTYSTLISEYFDVVKSTAMPNVKLYTQQPRVSSATLYTPKGSAGFAYYNLTCEDVGIKESELKEQNDYFKSVYPRATEVSTYTTAYNCHSYAWHSTATSNKYWINNPSPYITDGSYRSRKRGDSPQVKDKVTYTQKAFDDGEKDIEISHSAIVQSTAGNTIKVRSKWGMCSLFDHAVDYSPYSVAGVIYSYHYLAP